MSVARTVGHLSGLAGLVGMPAFLYQTFPDDAYWIYSTGCIIVILILSLFSNTLRNFFIPAAFRRHGLKFNNDRFRIPLKVEKIKISGDYSAKISTEKHFFFLEEPLKHDMVDIIEVLPGGKIDQSDYLQNNCDIVDIKKRKDQLVSIYWKPKNEIFLKNKTHKHKSSYICDGNNSYGPGFFWQGYIVDAETGQCQWLFECPEVVEMAYAFTLPKWRNNFTLKNLWRLGQISQLRNCQQPVIQKDQITVKWDIDNPKLGFSYVCIVIFKDGKHIFRTRAGI
jgi:hypothetical protein